MHVLTCTLYVYLRSPKMLSIHLVVYVHYNVHVYTHVYYAYPYFPLQGGSSKEKQKGKPSQKEGDDKEKTNEVETVGPSQEEYDRLQEGTVHTYSRRQKKVPVPFALHDRATVRTFLETVK